MDNISSLLSLISKMFENDINGQITGVISWQTSDWIIAHSNYLNKR